MLESERCKRSTRVRARRERKRERSGEKIIAVLFLTPFALVNSLPASSQGTGQYIKSWYDGKTGSAGVDGYLGREALLVRICTTTPSEPCTINPIYQSALRLTKAGEKPGDVANSRKV